MSDEFLMPGDFILKDVRLLLVQCTDNGRYDLRVVDKITGDLVLFQGLHQTVENAPWTLKMLCKLLLDSELCNSYTEDEYTEEIYKTVMT